MQFIWGYRNVVGKLLARLAPEINFVSPGCKDTVCKVLACNFQVSSGVCQDWESDQKDYQYLKASFCIMALSGSFFQEQWKNRHSPVGSAAAKLTCPSKWSV